MPVIYEPISGPLREAVAAVVLAGGRSTRMGADKAALLFGGRALVQHAVDAAAAVAGELVVAAAPGQSLPWIEASPPVRVLRDTDAYGGPLAALVTALGVVRAPVVLVLGCDQPLVRPALLRLVAERAAAGHAAVTPVSNGRPQPLCSAVRREALPLLRAMFEAGDRDARALTRLPGSIALPPAAWRDADPDGRSFLGVNTPEQLAAVALLLDAAAGETAS